MKEGKSFPRYRKADGKEVVDDLSKELLSASEAKGMSHQEQVEAVEVEWQNFVDHELPALTAEILEVLK